MSRLNGGMFASDRQDWSTPQAFYDLVDAEFGFTLDAAATSEDSKCSEYYSPEIDALTQSWPGTVWCNPPYGRGIKDWVRKGYVESQAGAVVVMLIPARTDTAYWHDYVMKADEVRLLRGRLVFGEDFGAIANAPFPSALIVFRPGDHRARFSSIGRGALTPRRRTPIGLESIFVEES